MTAQPVAMVPNAVKAPPAPIKGGRGLASFVDYIGSAGADFGATNGLLGSTALASSLRSRKLKLKDAPAAQDNGAASSDSSAAQALALSLSNIAAGIPSSANAAAGTAAEAALPLAGASGGRAVILANAALAASNNAPQGQANPMTPAAANGVSFLGLLAAGSSARPAGAQPDSPNASGDGTSPAPNGSAAPVTLSEATPAITPAGTPQPHQAGPPATAFVVNQFGAPGASSQKDPGATSSANAASPDKQTNAATPAATQAPSAAPGSSTVANTIATLPGAAALNARIVAGAATLSDHPNQAAASTTAALTQPADPNAGALPPSASPSNGKAHDNSGFGFGSTTTSAAAATPSTGANPATDPRGFAAAFDRAAAQAQAGISNDASKSNQDSSTDAASASASAASLPLAPADTSANPATAAPAPTDAGLHPALIALPVAAQVAINLRQALAAGTNEIQIQLKPASLGTIDVKLNVNHDGRLTAVISADRSDTLNLLKQDSSSLQQSLRDAGFSADSGSLSFNLRSDMQSFAQNNAAAPQLSAASSGVARALPAASAVIRAQRQHAGTLDIQV